MYSRKRGVPDFNWEKLQNKQKNQTKKNQNYRFLFDFAKCIFLLKPFSILRTSKASQSKLLRKTVYMSNWAINVEEHYSNHVDKWICNQ